MTAERDRLTALIKASGADPEMVRLATKLNTEEIAAAPSEQVFFPLMAKALAAVPEARLSRLAFQVAMPSNAICQSQTTGPTPPAEGVPAMADPTAGGTVPDRQAEVQLVITLPDAMPQSSKIMARKRITTALQALPGVAVLLDPTIAARHSVLNGGTGIGEDPTASRWCLRVSWTHPVLGKQEGT
jgi:hypothetical protein